LKYLKNTKELVIRYIFKNNIDIVTTPLLQLIQLYQYKTELLYFNRKNKLLINPSNLKVIFDKMLTYTSLLNIRESLEDHAMEDVVKLVIANQNKLAQYKNDRKG